MLHTKLARKTSQIVSISNPFPQHKNLSRWVGHTRLT
ncbi:hypothetical protein ACOMICROBIO_LMKGKHOH_01993 [Vibrio sp. B1FIG11]|nr:hypothetical protein ACOMICROBIO_LMKGKHOH_01993 [Vibrio sp. B1FIG11]CAE6899528.1 hypothetical protein ACOMICROBIO_LMKGKHOH_01993 [Vibrio sp. B1FIG11]